MTTCSRKLLAAILVTCCILAWWANNGTNPGMTADYPSDELSNPSIGKLTGVTIFVKDQDEALEWYTKVLGFTKKADDRSMPGFRWLTVGPKDQPDLQVVLLQAREQEMSLVGKNGTWVISTKNCRETAELLKSRGVRFVSEPTETPWGVSAVFLDLYGNPYNLIEPAAEAQTKARPAEQRSVNDEEQKRRAIEAALRRNMPGKHHQDLDPLVGKWSTSWKVWHAPGTPPADKAVGTAEFEWAQDGRFLRGTFKGEGILGRSFTAEVLLGYNTRHDHYEAAWVNSFETSVSRYSGQPRVGAKGQFQGLVLIGQADDCATGRRDVTYRSEIRLVDENTIIEEVYGPDPSGKEFKATEVVYKRVQRSALLNPADQGTR